VIQGLGTGKTRSRLHAGQVGRQADGQRASGRQRAFSRRGGTAAATHSCGCGTSRRGWRGRRGRGPRSLARATCRCRSGRAARRRPRCRRLQQRERRRKSRVGRGCRQAGCAVDNAPSTTSCGDPGRTRLHRNPILPSFSTPRQNIAVSSALPMVPSK
jgi:hypothetical protein